jgi:hypothetical protein
VKNAPKNTSPIVSRIPLENSEQGTKSGFGGLGLKQFFKQLIQSEPFAINWLKLIYGSSNFG